MTPVVLLTSYSHPFIKSVQQKTRVKTFNHNMVSFVHCPKGEGDKNMNTMM